eukprot:gene29462-5809_t
MGLPFPVSVCHLGPNNTEAGCDEDLLLFLVKHVGPDGQRTDRVISNYDFADGGSAVQFMSTKDACKLGKLVSKAIEGWRQDESVVVSIGNERVWFSASGISTKFESPILISQEYMIWINGSQNDVLLYEIAERSSCQVDSEHALLNLIQHGGGSDKPNGDSSLCARIEVLYERYTPLRVRVRVDPVQKRIDAEARLAAFGPLLNLEGVSPSPDAFDSLIIIRNHYRTRSDAFPIGGN